MKLYLRTLKEGRKTKSAPTVHLMVRDENYFLPFFFEHYRRIGFEEFWIYADRCSAATLDFLAQQPDTTLLTGDYTYGQTFGEQLTGHPRRLHQLLVERLDEVLPDKWVLVADADEFLILPPPAKDISQFIEALERANQPYSSAPMVEMYPQCLSLRNYDATINPFHMSIFFDEGPYYLWERNKLGPQSFIKGLWHRILRILIDRYPTDVTSIFQSRGVGPPSMYKVPLLKHGSGIRRIGNHRISAYPFTGNTAAIAHFKFSPCLDRKMATAIEEGQYFNASVAYKTLALATAKLPFENLVCAESKRFTGPDSLVAANLLSNLN